MALDVLQAAETIEALENFLNRRRPSGITIRLTEITDEEES